MIEARTAAAPPTFQYPGRGLHEAIDALMAYDHGATDSGVSDAGLRGAVRAYVVSLDDEASGRLATEYARTRYFTDEAMAQGYGLDDAVKFAEWLEDIACNG